MSAPLCARLGPYLDDALSAEEAQAFRDHLPGCPVCASALESALQLKALAAESRRLLEERGTPPAPIPAGRFTLPWHTSARIWVVSRLEGALEWAGLIEPGCFCIHGTYHGGDPRNFQPDDDQPEEQALHAQDCAAWDAAEKAGQPLPTARDLGKRIGTAAVGAFAQWSTYGYGTTLCQLHGHAPPKVKLLLRWRRALMEKIRRRP